MTIEDDLKEVAKVVSHWRPILCCGTDSFEADWEDGLVAIRCAHCKSLKMCLGLEEYKDLIGANSERTSA